MGEIIAAILLITSATGLIIFMRQKMPVTSIIPMEGTGLRDYLGKTKERIQRNGIGKKMFSPTLLLQMFLSKIRIVALRIDAKTNEWLIALRKRTQRKKEGFSEHYWKQIKEKHHHE